jgi:hypothetical protein
LYGLPLQGIATACKFNGKIFYSIGQRNKFESCGPALSEIKIFSQDNLHLSTIDFDV